MAKKKEEHPLQIVRDYLVKIERVFKEFYLFHGSICVGGKSDDDSALGLKLCLMEHEYQEAFNFVYGKKECLFFKVKEVKYDLDNINEYLEQVSFPLNIQPLIGEPEEKMSVREITDSKKIEKINKFADTMMKDFNRPNLTWKNLVNFPELTEAFFLNKEIFNMPVQWINSDDSSGNYITFAKQMIPNVSEKNMSSAFIYLETMLFGEDTLYKLLLDFQFTHFRLYVIYYCIPLPIN